MKKFTAQDVINMGAQLYDEHNFSRTDIHKWLSILVENGCADVDVDSVFDLIVG